MKKNVCFFIGIILFAGGSKSFAQADYRYIRPNDNQAWLWLQVDKDLNKKWTLGAQYQVRFYNDASTFKWSYWFGSVAYHFNKHLTAEGVFQFGESYTNNWYAFFGSLAYKHWFGRWRFSWRTAVQQEQPYLWNHWDPHNVSDLEWRNRLTIKYAIRRKVELSACAEPYLHLEMGNTYWSRSRNIFGVEWEFKKNQVINPFYMWQPDLQQPKPSNEHVLGLVYKITFPSHHSKKKNRKKDKHYFSEGY